MPYLAEGLALAAVAIGGLGIVWGALQGLRQRQVNVDELVSIAVIASVLAGEYLSAGLVVFMMIFGQLLEEATSQRATAALEHLAALQPERTHRMVGNAIQEVMVEDLQPGETVLAKPGERLPVDGLVVAGAAAVDEALVTGESLPVQKEPGHRVYAGTLNLDGALTIRTEAVGEHAYVGQIGRLLDALEEERAPIVRVADRYARYFTPAILIVAGATWLISGNLSSALAVLIVACPCALVLATPTAIVAGVANAARQGILVKGGARFEAAGAVDTVAVDKTGTLTLGTPVVQQVNPVDGMTSEELLSVAAAVERFSEHPLGMALVRYAAEKALSLPPRGRLSRVSRPGRGRARRTTACPCRYPRTAPRARRDRCTAAGGCTACWQLAFGSGGEEILRLGAVSGYRAARSGAGCRAPPCTWHPTGCDAHRRPARGGEALGRDSRHRRLARGLAARAEG